MWLLTAPVQGDDERLGHEIAWWRTQIGKKVSTYVAAQKILDVLSNGLEPLWEVGRGHELLMLVTLWDENPRDRESLETTISTILASLSASDLPPRSKPT